MNSSQREEAKIHLEAIYSVLHDQATTLQSKESANEAFSAIRSSIGTITGLINDVEYDNRPQLKKLTTLMELVLRLHDPGKKQSKTGWEPNKCKASFLLTQAERSCDNLKEKYETLMSCNSVSADTKTFDDYLETKQTETELVKEAIDTVNYVMMLLDNLGLL